MIGSALLKAIDGVIASLYALIVYPFKDLHTIQGLIFGTNDLVFKTFHKDELLNAYNPGVHIMMLLAGVFLISGIVVGGIKITSGGLTPSGRTNAIEFGKDLLLVTIVIMNLGFFYNILFYVNDAFVDIFKIANDATMAGYKNSLDAGPGLLGEIIINLTLLGLSVWANFYYMMRKLTLIILMILGPIIMVMWLIPQFKKVTVSWLQQLTGTIFIQAINAVVFWLVTIISGQEPHVIGQAILFMLFIPVSESIRALLGLGGDMHSKLSMAGAAMGLSALSSVAGAVKGAYSSNNSSKKKDKAGEKDKSEDKESGSLAANSGTDSGTSSNAEKMLKSGSFVSKMGKAVVGAGGAIAGSPLGATGSAIGGATGFGIGGVVGGVVGRTGAAGIQGIGNRIKKGLEDSKYALAGNEGKLEDALADNLAEEQATTWAAQNKSAFISDMKNHFPDATDEDIENKFNSARAEKKAGFKKDATNTVSSMKSKDGQLAKADLLSQNAANSLTAAWAGANKEQAYAQMEAEHPGLSQKEKDDRWNDQLANKRQEFSQASAITASNLSNGVSPSVASISKKAFSTALSKNLAINDEKDLKAKLISSGLKDSEVDVELRKQQGANQKLYADAISNSTNNTAGQSLISNGHLNKEHFASLKAADMTMKMGEQYKQSLVAQGMSDSQAEKQWQSQARPEAYQNNYQQALNSIDNGVSTSKALTPGNYALKKAAAVTAFVGGATGLSTLKTIAQQSPYGALANYENAKADGENKLNRGLSYIGGAASVANDHILGQTPVDKHQSVVRGASYGAGVVFGAGGYRAAANYVSNHNPFNKGVQEQAKEVNEILQMAPTQLDQSGNRALVPGSVKLVTTNDQSYIQATNKMGQTQIVSRYGSGNASLPKGQAVFQDLQVQGGTLGPTMAQGKPMAYTIDSSGGKVPFSQPINVNPNKLLATKRPQAMPKAEHPTYNHLVDGGGLFLNNVQGQVKNIKMITERNRSYMAGENIATGETVRLSPYKQGDTRLKNEEVVYTTCDVVNQRLVKRSNQVRNAGVEIVGKGEQWTSSFNPNEMILPTKPNPRSEKRREAERKRQINGVN